MPNITFPDGSSYFFQNKTTALEIAQFISKSLAESAVAVKIEKRIYNLSYLIEDDVTLKIITSKDEEGLEIIRISCAYLLGQAIKNLYPNSKIVSNSESAKEFYCDIFHDPSFTLKEIELISLEMRKLITKNSSVASISFPINEAREMFRVRGEDYKVDLLKSIVDRKFIDLCICENYMDTFSSVHVPNRSFLKHFKITRLSGAYWKGDASNKQLQRIYITAWANKKDLTDYLQQKEQAEKRDHRKIGKKLNLFHLQEEAPGMVFWHPHGWIVYQCLEKYIRKVQDRNNYLEIRTPQIIDSSLWKKSGHLENYVANIFITESESRSYAIKPMNCPGHIQVFKQKTRSYRELPIRFSEFGSCHRKEPSGSLHGIMRVRGFTQDDAHIFCTEAQIQSETAKFIEIAREVYSSFGFDDVQLMLSTRPKKRVGSDILWEFSEKALASALDKAGLKYSIQEGEGAFYGPKIEFSLKDSLNRVWQCGTLQLDFNLPKSLCAEYISENNERKNPVMLHRAILGSFERFIGILIEHYEGRFPTWLAPVQVVIMTIKDSHNDYGARIKSILDEGNFRTKLDLRNEKIGFKVRENILLKIPYLLVIGDKEVEQEIVSIRTLEGGTDMESISLNSLLEYLTQ